MNLFGDFSPVCAAAGLPQILSTDPVAVYGRPEKKLYSLHGQKFNPNPKFLGAAEQLVFKAPLCISLTISDQSHYLNREW